MVDKVLYKPFKSSAKNKKYSVYVLKNGKKRLIHFGDMVSIKISWVFIQNWIIMIKKGESYIIRGTDRVRIRTRHDIGVIKYCGVSYLSSLLYKGQTIVG